MLKNTRARVLSVKLSQGRKWAAIKVLFRILFPTGNVLQNSYAVGTTFRNRCFTMGHTLQLQFSCLPLLTVSLCINQKWSIKVIPKLNDSG